MAGAGHGPNCYTVELSVSGLNLGYLSTNLESNFFPSSNRVPVYTFFKLYLLFGLTSSTYVVNLDLVTSLCCLCAVFWLEGSFNLELSWCNLLCGDRDSGEKSTGDPSESLHDSGIGIRKSLKLFKPLPRNQFK